MMERAPDAVDQSLKVTDVDVCVIGAGAAGLVLAEILSRKEGLRVCLLEAGPDHFKDRKEPFRVRSLLKEHIGVNEGRVTAFGGATNTWGGGLMRLSPADFEPLDARPDTAWPIPYQSLVPHYEAVESMFGFAATPEGPESIFLDRADVCVRRREIPILSFRSKNFSQRFGPTLRGRSNVTILCNASITRFSPSPTGEGRLSHLDVEIKDGTRLRVMARRYVVSAGIVNTNLLAERIFKACSAGKAGSLDKPGLFFHDHLSFPIAILRPKSQGKFSRRFGYRFERGLMLGEHFDIETKDSRLPGAFFHLGFDTSGSSILRPVRKVLSAIQERTFSLKGAPTLREIGPMLIGLPRLGLMRYLRRRLYLDPGTRILATLDLEQVPRREWKLEPERDGPGCSVTWDVTPDDAAHAARYIPICREILRKLQAEAAFEIEEVLPEIESDPNRLIVYLKEHAEDTYHSAGGLRMSAAPNALVDPELRLSHVSNVHVLSAAVFPRVGTSNPTHTILALGHRLAQYLLNTLAVDRASRPETSASSATKLNPR